MESITKYFEIIKEKRFKMALKYTTSKKKKKKKRKRKKEKKLNKLLLFHV